MSMSDLAPLFATLKSVLEAHAANLDVVTNDPGHFYANTTVTEAKGKPVFFGMVKQGKKKISFHFMPVYDHPELLDEISDALRKRMQGKSCFNFSADDPELFQELIELVEAGKAAYQASGKI